MRKSLVALAAGVLIVSLSACGTRQVEGPDDSNVPRYSIGGEAVGLGGIEPVVLTDGFGHELTVATNGPFNFPTPIAKGKAFSVAVRQSPAALTCKVSGGSGQVGDGPVVDIAVSCVCRDGDICVTLILPDGATSKADFIALDRDFNPSNNTTTTSGGYTIPPIGSPNNVPESIVVDGRIVETFKDVTPGTYYLYAYLSNVGHQYEMASGDFFGVFGHDLACADIPRDDLLWKWTEKYKAKAIVPGSGHAAFDIEMTPCGTP